MRVAVSSVEDWEIGGSGRRTRGSGSNEEEKGIATVWRGRRTGGIVGGFVWVGCSLFFV